MNDIELAYLPQLLKLLSERFADETVLKIACLGYPDVVVAQSTYNVLFKPDSLAKLETRANSDSLTKAHGRKNVQSVPSFEYLLEAIRVQQDIAQKIEATYFDFRTYTGTEILHDFNDPIAKDHYDTYHLVWSGGTIEHIFDIATAFKNVVYITKAGGLSYHAGPFNMVNHGFYNLCPLFFSDFCHPNGCAVMTYTLANLLEPYDTFDLPAIDRRFVVLPERELIFIAVLEKREHRDQLVNPVQGRYKEKEAWV